MEEEKSRQKLSSALRSDFNEWSTTTSIHGLPNIARSESLFLTVVWIICICGSAGYCTYSIYTSFVGYFQFNVQTQIQSVYENPSPFPTITLCNLNPFVTNEGLQYTYDVMVSNGIDNVVSSPLLAYLYPHPYQSGINTYMSNNLVISNAKNQPDSVKQTFGMDINSSLPMCFYNLDSCHFETFNWYYSYKHGNCYQFNAPFNSNGTPNDMIYTYKTGLKYGLGMLIFTGFPTSVNSLTFGRGGHLFIHNQSSGPESTSGLDFSPGYFTNIVISRVFSQQLPKPYNDCYEDLTTPDKFDSFYYRETLKSGYTYRQVDCLNLVEQDEYIKSCDCADPGFPTLYGKRFCQYINESYCLYLKFFKMYASGMNKDWFQYCPLECSTDQFTFSVSSSTWPSKSLADILVNVSFIRENLDYIGEPYTYESLRDNFAYVNIYYDYSGYTLISESPAQELIDLLSSVGGTLGLYLGMSFLSFVELFELLAQMAFTTFQRLSQVKRNKKEKTKGEISKNQNETV